MQHVNMYGLFLLGQALSVLKYCLAPGNDLMYVRPQLYMVKAAHLLSMGDDLTNFLPRSGPTLEKIMRNIDTLLGYRTEKPTHRLSELECNILSENIRKFELILDDELAALDVFFVMKKGIYDTTLLISESESRFGEKKALLPDQSLYDFRMAGRCLAFEVPTASAFHALRSAEALMIYYYEQLTGHAWQLPRNRDWNAYIQHLGKEGAPTQITNRLDEIRQYERNPILHPDHNVDPDKALTLFEMIGGVMSLMLEETQRINVAKMGAS